MSRYHAVIKYIKEDNKLLLKNLSETTGTMVLIKDNDVHLPYLDQKILYLQSGTTSIEASIVRKSEFDEIEKKENKRKEELEKEY